jgi:hypothetical protein
MTTPPTGTPPPAAFDPVTRCPTSGYLLSLASYDPTAVGTNKWRTLLSVDGGNGGALPTGIVVPMLGNVFAQLACTACLPGAVFSVVTVP